MRKLLLIFVSLIFLSLGFFSKTYAFDSVEAEKEETSEISSFELFWPMVAGKTIDDPLYILKSLKEKVRGFLIFGKPQKAEYYLFLVTKRVLEAEALINNGNKNLALRTLDMAISYAKKASNNLVKGQFSDLNVVETKNKLENLNKFLQWYQARNEGEVKDKMVRLQDQVDEILSKIKS